MKTEDPNKILIDDNKEEEVDPFGNLMTLVTSLVPLLYATLTLGLSLDKCPTLNNALPRCCYNLQYAGSSKYKQRASVDFGDPLYDLRILELTQCTRSCLYTI